MRSNFQIVSDCLLGCQTVREEIIAVSQIITKEFFGSEMFKVIQNNKVWAEYGKKKTTRCNTTFSYKMLSLSIL